MQPIVTAQVCHNSEPCKNGWTIRDAVWVVGLDVPKDRVLDGVHMR